MRTWRMHSKAKVMNNSQNQDLRLTKKEGLEQKEEAESDERGGFFFNSSLNMHQFISYFHLINESEWGFGVLGFWGFGECTLRLR